MGLLAKNAKVWTSVEAGVIGAFGASSQLRDAFAGLL